MDLHDGTGTAAQFNVPGGIAFDSNGNLYVADAANETIRKVVGILRYSQTEIVTAFLSILCFGAATAGLKRMDDLTIVEKQGAVREVTFPYVPGLLSFRETPALLDAFAKVESDLISRGEYEAAADLAARSAVSLIHYGLSHRNSL